MLSRDGYFSPESVIRRIGNDPLVPLLGGGPAVLLQVAHPLVAAGVVAHSDYRRDLWRRLLRTLRAVYLIVYGNKAEAERAGAAVQAVHARVVGRTTEQMGPFPPGTPYSASDPELMLWVHSTLVETALVIYRRFVGPLASGEDEAFYREMALVARLFGTPADVIPPTLADFHAYVRGELSGRNIVVTPAALDVAETVLDAPVRGPLRLAGPAHRLATAALLPPRLRREYGLRWSSAHAAALPVAARSLRLVVLPLARAADQFSRVAA